MRVSAIKSGSRHALARLYRWLRQVSGDAAYEDYLRSVARRADLEQSAPLGAREFYLDQLQRRFSRPNKCC